MGVIFLDVSKAFDRVWHEGLIYMRRETGYSRALTKLLWNYLKNRRFRIKLNKTKSELGWMEAGSPQRAVLSSVLCNIYTADIAKTGNTLMATRSKRWLREDYRKPMTESTTGERLGRSVSTQRIGKPFSSRRTGRRDHKTMCT